MKDFKKDYILMYIAMAAILIFLYLYPQHAPIKIESPKEVLYLVIFIVASYISSKRAKKSGK